jgi:hypothetical protein
MTKSVNINYNSLSLLIVAVLLYSGISYGQKDTTKPGGIDIVSSFKPVLREAAKINFNASPAPVDTSKVKQTYDIPNQNLLFAYQPGSLKPLALEVYVRHMYRLVFP